MRRATALLASFAIVFAGCADDEDDGAASDTTTTVAEADDGTASTTVQTTSETAAGSSTTSTPSPAPAPAPAGELTLVLQADGVGFLGAGDDDTVDSLEFGTPQQDAIDGIASALGAPLDIGDQEECPAGPAAFARFGDGFSATFQDGAIVGWNIGDGSTLTTIDGLGIGSSAAELAASLPDAVVEETTIGFEITGADLNGLVTGPGPDGVVDALWAGTTCIFR